MGGESEGYTFGLLEHALDGAGTAGAGHGDIEVVVVLGVCCHCLQRMYVDLGFGKS